MLELAGRCHQRDQRFIKYSNNKRRLAEPVWCREKMSGGEVKKLGSVIALLLASSSNLSKELNFLTCGIRKLNEIILGFFPAQTF